MKRRYRGLKRRDALCPECGYIFTITYNPDVRYFQAPRERCPECSYVGRRSEFGSPQLEDYTK